MMIQSTHNGFEISEERGTLGSHEFHVQSEYIVGSYRDNLPADKATPLIREMRDIDDALKAFEVSTKSIGG